MKICSIKSILPLFNVPEDDCSFCFPSTNTEVGKLQTSNVVDNKTTKNKSYFKISAIFKTT